MTSSSTTNTRGVGNGAIRPAYLVPRKDYREIGTFVDAGLNVTFLCHLHTDQLLAGRSVAPDHRLHRAAAGNEAERGRKGTVIRLVSMRNPAHPERNRPA